MWRFNNLDHRKKYSLETKLRIIVTKKQWICIIKKKNNEFE